MLQRFLASPPDQRQQYIQRAQNTALGQQYGGSILQIANTCNNY